MGHIWGSRDEGQSQAKDPQVHNPPQILLWIIWRKKCLKNNLQRPLWLLSLATPLFFLHKTHLGSNKKWQKHNCGEIDVQNIEDCKNVHGTHLQATQTQFELGKPQPSNQIILNYQELFAK